MSSVPTTAHRPEQTDSAEQAWFELEAEILVAEVEDFLATAAQPADQRKPRPPPRPLPAARPRPRPRQLAVVPDGHHDQHPPPTRSPPNAPLHSTNIPTVTTIPTRQGGDAHAKHPYQQPTYTGPAQRPSPWAGPPLHHRSQSTTRSSRTRCTRCQTHSSKPPPRPPS